MRLRTCLFALALAIPGPTAQLRAQGLPASTRLHLEAIEIPRWVDAGTLLGANLLLAGLSAGVVSELRGGSFFDAFAKGAAGGSIVYLGKQVSARRFDGAGLLGRQLVSVGSGIVRNGAAGLGVLDRLELSFGPADLVIDSRTRRVGARVDPVGLAALAVAALDEGVRLDGAETLSSGTPVFRSAVGLVRSPWSDLESCGLEVAGVIVLGECSRLGGSLQERVLAHERLHAVQAETFQAYWGRPLLEWVLPERDPWPRLRPFLDLNVGEALVSLGDALFFARYGSRPWEIEAEALAVGGR